MPTLFLLLGERLKLDVSLSTAPLHMFVRYTDPEGRAFNIEATSGANLARLAWYREKLPMSDRAIESGVYMRTLTKREAVAHMASTVMDWLITEGRFEDAIAVADVILEHYPLDAYVMVKRGTTYGDLLRTEFVQRYATPTDVPVDLRSRYQMLAMRNAQDFARAEALGWEPFE